MYKNKVDGNGKVKSNKLRLMVQWFNQEEGINYNETFVPVVKLKEIRLLVVFSTFKEYTLYQMDVNNALLNKNIKEEVYVKKPPGFESIKFPDHFYKLEKALHMLKNP